MTARRCRAAFTSHSFELRPRRDKPAGAVRNRARLVSVAGDGTARRGQLPGGWIAGRGAVLRSPQRLDRRTAAERHRLADLIHRLPVGIPLTGIDPRLREDTFHKRPVNVASVRIGYANDETTFAHEQVIAAGVRPIPPQRLEPA